MLGYSLRIAYKSLFRNPVLTLVLVGAIAIGVALSTTFAAVRHAYARDPLPEKSARLCYVRLDSWDPLAPYPGDDPKSLPSQVTYRDAMEIIKSSIPLRQSASYKTQLYVHPTGGGDRPSREYVRLVYRDFFAMFDAKFRYGASWSKEADEKGEPAIVLGEAMNDRLFGGKDSVGKTVRIDETDFRVAGVLEHWDLGLKVYDLTQMQIEAPDQIFMPLAQGIAMKARTFGNTDSWKTPEPGFEGFLQSEIVWLQFWVELKDEASIPAYEDFLRGYALEQKKLGRFQRPVNNRVTPLTAYMEEMKTVPPEANSLFAVSLFIFVLCSLNLVGILLGKFLARANEVGVRRALGASRGDIFLQHIVECEIVGVLGGVIGIGLSTIGIAVLNNSLKLLFNRGDLFHLDVPTLAFSIALALASGLVAGLYPAWRIASVPPAAHLKAS